MADKSKRNTVKPKACVLIVANGNRDTICETLDSIAKNTYRPLHILLVDNDSADGTYEMLCDKLGIEKIEFEGQMALPPKIDSEWGDVPITCIRKRKTTIGHSLNVGLGMVPPDTEYFVFVQDTDLLNSKKIARSVRILSKYDFVGCVISDCFEQHGPTPVRIYNQTAEPNRLIQNFPYDGNFVVPKKFIAKFNDKLPCCHDMEFVLKMGERGIIYLLPEALYTRKSLVRNPQEREVERQIKRSMGIVNG